MASVLASVIHSTYSRLLLGENFSKVARAALLAARASSRSFGTASGGLGALDFMRLGVLTPSSFSFIACLMYPVRTFFEGRSESLVIRPNESIAFSSALPLGTISSLFQKPKAQCSLNADMAQSGRNTASVNQP